MFVKRKWLDEDGFTLVELMVAVVSAALILFGIVTIFGTISEGVDETESVSTQQRSAQMILDAIAEDLRTGASIVYRDSNTAVTITDSEGNTIAYDLISGAIMKSVNAGTPDNLVVDILNQNITVDSVQFLPIAGFAKQRVQVTLVTGLGNVTDPTDYSRETHIIKVTLRNS
ncbi:MAG: PilW family protein [bacterium]